VVKITILSFKEKIFILIQYQAEKKYPDQNNCKMSQYINKKAGNRAPGINGSF